MPSVSLDPIGIIVEWSCSALLFLLFFRIGSASPRRRMLWTWMAAWAAQAIAISGWTVQAVAGLTGNSIERLVWLDELQIPLTLAFAALLALAAAQTAGRRISFTASQVIVGIALALGAVLDLVAEPIAAGVVLVVAILVISYVGAIVIARVDRRRQRRRLAIVAALAGFGTVASVYLLTAYFGGWFGVSVDVSSIVIPSWGYGMALMSAALGGAVIILVIDDAARFSNYARGERVREFAVSAARLTEVMGETDLAVAAARQAADAERQELGRRLTELNTIVWRTEPPRRDPIAIGTGSETTVASPAQPIRPVITEVPPVISDAPPQDSPQVVAAPPAPRVPDSAAPATMPSPSARIPTLPAAPRRADGSIGEVMLIDHDAAERATLARIFRRGGWRVREISSGEEALTALVGVDDADGPDLILCSSALPGHAAAAVHEHLQLSRPELARRLVFVERGDADQAAAKSVSRAGRPLVEHPLSVASVARAVEQVLAN